MTHLLRSCRAQQSLASNTSSGVRNSLVCPLCWVRQSSCSCHIRLINDPNPDAAAPFSWMDEKDNSYALAELQLKSCFQCWLSPIQQWLNLLCVKEGCENSLDKSTNNSQSHSPQKTHQFYANGGSSNLAVGLVSINIQISAAQSTSRHRQFPPNPPPK